MKEFNLNLFEAWDEINALNEDNEDNVNIPDTFTFKNYSKENINSENNRSGIYLIVCPRIENGRLISVNQKLTTKEIHTYPHYVGKARNFKDRLYQHLAYGFYGSTSSEPFSKLHIYFNMLKQFKNITDRDAYYDLIANTCKFYTYELELSSVSNDEEVNYSKEFNGELIADIINNNANDWVLTDIANRIGLHRAKYYNAISNDKTLNTYEMAWVDKFKWNNSADDFIYLNRISGGINLQQNSNQKNQDDNIKRIIKVIKVIILLRYTFYPTATICKLSGVKEDSVRDINSLYTNQFITTAVLGEISGDKIRKVDFSKTQLDRPIGCNVIKYDNSEVIKDFVLPSTEALYAFCGYIFNTYKFESVSYKPVFGNIGITRVISDTRIYNKGEDCRISFTDSNDTFIDAWNNYKNFILSYCKNTKVSYKTKYLSSDKSTADSLVDYIDILISDYKKIDVSERAAHQKWPIPRVNQLKNLFLGGRTAVEIADNPSLLNFPDGTKLSKSEIKNALHANGIKKKY